MQERINLPIGSVVKIKNGENLFMITGYMIKNGNETYDYCGCLFPEGILSFNDVITFNHEKIETILFEGYKNDDYNKLNIIINNFNK